MKDNKTGNIIQNGQLRQQQAEEEVKKLTQHLARYPKDIKSVQKTALTLINQYRDPDNAIACYDQFIALHPENMPEHRDGLFHKACLLYKTCQPLPALRFIEHVTRIDPTYKEARLLRDLMRMTLTRGGFDPYQLTQCNETRVFRDLIKKELMQVGFAPGLSEEQGRSL